MDRAAFVRTLQTLEHRHPLDDWSRGMTPFEILVSTILSQSTTAANERRALEDLRRTVGAITPEVLAAARVPDIARAIWHAGLSAQKAPRIRGVAREVMARWDGSLDPVLSRPTGEARELLMSLPGVGPKTADVVLAMGADHPTFPVDTHIARIARRWGLVTRDDYEATRAVLEAWTPATKRKAWHLAIIGHGRELCKARRPLCDRCPVRADCDWYRRRSQETRDAARVRGRPGRRATKG